ncbi:MAG TPA: Bax inhibitor-1/YccA family protein [Myxococcota bacterium]|nr:Bax inhibitor-1/YccA family protein [Myxococcota bacterium]
MNTSANDVYRRSVNAGDRAHASSELASFFAKTYAWMGLGLAMTGCVAVAVVNSETMMNLIYGNRAMVCVLLFGQIALVWAFAAMAHRVSGTTAALMFTAYAASVGLTLSSIFLVYSQSSITQMFFVTAGAFGGLSLVGATTKRDLTPIGRFMMMGLFGLVIAVVVSWFWQNSAFQFVMSCAGVLIFSGLTAYDTQKLKNIYSERGEAGNLALRGALTLYLDFINLFLFLLRLFGSRRD